MLEQTDNTVMFYWWEPSALVNEHKEFIRVYFDARVACPPPGVTVSSTNSLYPQKVACDFAPGNPEKAHSERITRAGLRDVRTAYSPIRERGITRARQRARSLLCALERHHTPGCTVRAHPSASRLRSCSHW